MRIQFEIKEKLPEIIQEILHSDKWQTSVKEEISGRTTVVIRDQAYGSEATIEIYAQSIEIKTAWSKYFYRILQPTISSGVNIMVPIVDYWNKCSYQPLLLKKACLILMLRRVHSMVENIKN